MKKDKKKKRQNDITFCPFKPMEGYNHESSFVDQKNLRQVQNHPSQRQNDGNLLEPQAQAAAGLKAEKEKGERAAQHEAV